MSTLAIYPGTFDPLTHGHVDLIRRAACLFERLILAVSGNPRKRSLFTLKERLAMARRVAQDFRNVEVDAFDGLLVDYTHRKGAQVIIRGLRAFSDFEYEFQMALTNRTLAPDLETLFMMTKEDYSYFSSSMVSEIAELGGNTSEFVPDFVQAELARKFKKG